MHNARVYAEGMETIQNCLHTETVKGGLYHTKTHYIYIYIYIYFSSHAIHSLTYLRIGCHHDIQRTPLALKAIWIFFSPPKQTKIRERHKPCVPFFNVILFRAVTETLLRGWNFCFCETPNKQGLRHMRLDTFSTSKQNKDILLCW